MVETSSLLLALDTIFVLVKEGLDMFALPFFGKDLTTSGSDSRSFGFLLLFFEEVTRLLKTGLNTILSVLILSQIHHSL